MMSLSTQHLRDDIKTNIDKLVDSTLQEKTVLEELWPEIQHAAQRLEKNIQEKICLLESDFNDLTLTGDYLRTVREGFDDIERLMRHSQTFIDVVKCKDKITLIEHIQHHYRNILIPLLNIMSKLENDYISATHQAISKKQALLNELQTTLKKLKSEEKSYQNSYLIYNKKQKIGELQKKIKYLDLKRKVLQLTLHHDRLNLYYFNHDHPKEMREIKQKADSLRFELNQYKEVSDYDAL